MSINTSFAKCGCYSGSVPAGEDVLPLLAQKLGVSNLRPLGFTLMCSAFTEIQLSDYSKVATMPISQNSFCVNVGTAQKNLNVYINKLIFSEACEVVVNFYY